MFCRIGTVCPISPCLGPRHGPTRLDQSGPNPLARLSTDKVKKGVQEPGLEWTITKCTLHSESEDRDLRDLHSESFEEGREE